MFRYFLPDQKLGMGQNLNINKLKELREQFPFCNFKDGKHKGCSGIYVIKDLYFKGEYGDPLECAQVENALVWVAKDLDISEFEDDINSFVKLPVELYNNQVLNIIPAVCEPQKVLFGAPKLKKEEIPAASRYNKSSRYGQLCYDFIYRLYREEQVEPNEWIELAEQALVYSYTCPLDIFNAWGGISNQDIERIALAGMGIQPEPLKKTAMSTSHSGVLEQTTSECQET